MIPLGLLNSLVVTWLGRRHPGKSLVDIGFALTGKPVTWLVGVIYVWFFVHVAAVSLRDFGELFLHGVMPQTPLLVFQVTIAALVALAVKNGIEVLARTAEVVFLIIPIAIMIILLGNIPNMRFNQLLPLLSDGAAPVARGVLTHWPWFGEIVVWTLLFPFFQQNKQCRRALNLSVPIAGLTLLGVTVSVLAVFTPYRAPAMRYPLFQLAAFVVGGEFRGMESFFLFLWIFINFVKLSLFTLATAVLLKDLLGLQDYRSLVLPLVTLEVPLSLILFDNYFQLLTFMHPGLLAPYELPLELGIPLLLLLISLVRKRP